jgi:hypothetical protein
MAEPFLKAGRWYSAFKDRHGRWRYLVLNAKTKAEAKRLNAEMEEARIRQGLDQPALVNGDETFGDLVEWWIAERLAQTRAYKRCAGTVRRHILASSLAKLAPAELTPGKVDNFLYSKADEIGLPP